MLLAEIFQQGTKCRVKNEKFRSLYNKVGMIERVDERNKYPIVVTFEKYNTFCLLEDEIELLYKEDV